MSPAGIIGVLCTTLHEGALLYIRNRMGPGAGNRKPESRAAVPRRGVRWRPGLTDNQIVLPSRAAAHTPNE
jgi:hypothetical protein